MHNCPFISLFLWDTDRLYQVSNAIPYLWLNRMSRFAQCIMAYCDITNTELSSILLSRLASMLKFEHQR